MAYVFAVGLASMALAEAMGLPLLFMDKQDIVSPWGRMMPKANSVAELPQFRPPPCDWVNGDTVFAAFPVLNASGLFEVFVAVGRPGEPLSSSSASAEDPIPPLGVNITRFTTTDFVKWSDPVTVLYLPNGSGDKATGEHVLKDDVGDGKVWTAKSMDRNADTGEYLMAASYGAAARMFRGVRPSAPDAFKVTTGDLKKPNFKDHDDVNLYFDSTTNRWVDIQITYQVWNKTYCDNCKGARRIVTTRTSAEGTTWSDDASCLDHPQKDEHCQHFNTTNMIAANPETDPPELEFYRVRAFQLGDSGRLAAHALLYVPSPKEIVVQPGYGRQPLWYCKDGCCHGPHMYEEWWVGPHDADPTKMTEWRRPFFDTRAFPHDIWAMAQPLVHDDKHVWVDNGKVWGLPLYRMSGIYTSSNAEFSTQVFAMPASPLWVNAQVLWHGGNHVGNPEGCDEGCAAYLMAELQDADTGNAFPGYEKKNCIIMNRDGLRLPLTWSTTLAAPSSGSRVQVRFFFRDATIYAIGSGNEAFDRMELQV